jgi:hypothetical protein
MSSYEWDTSCADLELARLEHGFTDYDHTNFARVLFKNFAQTLADVHIITGSLLASGKTDVTESTHERWHGYIAFGGPSYGVKNPVRYAVSELYGRSLNYGGPESHDYMRNTRFIDEEMAGPVSSFITRGRRTPHPEGR